MENPDLTTALPKLKALTTADIAPLTTANITPLTTAQIANLNVQSTSFIPPSLGSSNYYNYSNNSDVSFAQSGRMILNGANADIEINGVSLKNTLDNINKRLNILQPNKSLESDWEELKQLGDQYRALEKELEEKSEMWEILKNPLPKEN
jgi:hypothetical protein